MAPIKFLASQVKYINLYKNLRTKVMKCCANIYFNRQLYFIEYIVVFWLDDFLVSTTTQRDGSYQLYQQTPRPQFVGHI
jgi:hypothetical protein